MAKAVVAAAVFALCAGGCATATPPDLVTREGYLSSAPPGLRFYATTAGRDAGSRQACVQIIRSEAAQAASVPDGRVRIRGREGQFDEDLMKLQVGDDHATHELCDSRYIIWAEITPIPET